MDDERFTTDELAAGRAEARAEAHDEATPEETELNAQIWTDPNPARSYRTAVDRERWFVSLETEKPHLAGRRDLVEATLERHWKTLKDLPAGAARSEVADIMEREGLAGPLDYPVDAAVKPQQRDSLGSAIRARQQRRVGGKDSELPESLSAAIRARQQARFEAKHRS